MDIYLPDLEGDQIIEIGTVVVTGKYLVGDDVEVYPVKEAEAFDLAKVSATRAGLYQLSVAITPKSATAVEYLKGSNNDDPFYGYYVSIYRYKFVGGF